MKKHIILKIMKNLILLVIAFVLFVLMFTLIGCEKEGITQGTKPGTLQVIEKDTTREEVCWACIVTKYENHYWTTSGGTIASNAFQDNYVVILEYDKCEVVDKGSLQLGYEEHRTDSILNFWYAQSNKFFVTEYKQNVKCDIKP